MKLKSTLFARRFSSRHVAKQSGSAIQHAAIETLESRQLLSVSLAVTPKTIAATEGQNLSNVVIASFSSSDPSLAASKYSADVSWGSGPNSTGAIVSLGNGKFNVTGGHLYTAHGAFPVQVYIHLNNTTVATTAHSSAQVADAAVTMVAQKFTLNGGQANPVLVATFTDPFPDSPNYTATINWGDNSPTTAGAIVPVTGKPGQFRITGAHAYASINVFPVTVTLNNHGQLSVAKSTATVQHVYTDLLATAFDGLTNDSATPGSPYGFSVSVKNLGGLTLSSINFNDTLPSALNSPVFKPSAGSYNPTTHIWSGLSFTPGETIRMLITGTIDSAATTTLVNTAVVSPTGGLIDTNPANNTTTRNISLNSSNADLGINIAGDDSGGDDPVPAVGVIPGDPNGYTYTITITNKGPADVKNATIADDFPAAVLTADWTAVASGTSGAVFNASGSGDIKEFVDLPNGAFITYTVKTTIDPAATGQLIDKATITEPAGITDGDKSNNSATETDTLTPVADLSVKMSVAQATGNEPNLADLVPNGIVASEIKYTIAVKNLGPSNPSDIKLTDLLPASLSYVSSDASTGSYDNTTGIWTIGTLGGAKLDIFASVTTSSPVTNTATISSASAADPDITNNFASQTIAFV